MAAAAILRRRLFVLGIGNALALSLGGCRSVDLLPPSMDNTGLFRAQTQAALPMVNSLRQGRGLGSLMRQEDAERAAIGQARRMARAGQMAHLIGPGDIFLDRMKSFKVPLPAAENVAAGQSGVERAVEAWILSHHHLENMLGPYTGLGVAVAFDEASANKPYWAMVLCA